MSTPSDPRSGGQPDERSGAPGPSEGSGQQPAQPGQYGQQPDGHPGGQYGQPGQYGPQPGYDQAPAYNPYAQQGPPQYGQPGQYNPYGQPQPYNPYGQPGQYAGTPFSGAAAGLGPDEPERVARPGIMVLALVLLILSALPFIMGGLAGLTAPSDPNQLPPELAPPPGYLEQTGLSPEQYAAFLKAIGGVVLVLPLIYLLFAVLAFLGRNWARITLTVMTVGFTLMLLASMLIGLAAVPSALVIVLVIAAASVGGTIIMFLPEPSRWFRSAHR